MKIWLNSENKQEPYEMSEYHIHQMHAVAEAFELLDAKGTESKEQNMEGIITSERQQEYSGFVVLECESCHRIRTFCARKPMSGFLCKECGKVTPLKDLKTMYMKCRCGKDWSYKTNLSVPEYTGKCLECKQPVKMKLNKGGTSYITVQQEG